MLSLQPGRTLGPYEILCRLGGGGMGEVYKARDTRLGREVALKFIRDDILGNPESRLRFLREARTTSMLNHPNIVSLYDICNISEMEFLVVEYVPGRTLAACQASRPLPLPQCLKVANQICSALECAHAAGIVHRDLKPANIVVTDSGAIKVLDFGLARTIALERPAENDPTETAVTEAGTLVGTGPYMSPEQIEGKSLDCRSDIFSFGAILYEMLTGRSAFARSTVPATLAAVLSEQPYPAAAPPPVQRVLRRCLAKDPAERFTSAAELHAALEEAASAGNCPSAAVLPLVDLSPNRDHEWLADGLAEDIINALSRVAGIRVSARTSSFRFRGRNEDLFEIGRLLHVEAILEGSIRAIGDRVRITVQLINVADGFPLWSERFDRRLDDIFAVQDEIAFAIVSAFRDKFGIDSIPVRQARSTASGEAYRLYLQGRFWWNRRDAASVIKAISFFTQATECDPTFALALSGLADAHSSLGYFGTEDPKPHAERCREFALRAAALAPERPEVHGSLGLASSMVLDLSSCEKHYRTAAELGPRHPMALYEYGSVLALLGHHQQGLSYLDRAIDIEPLLLPALTWRAFVLHWSRRHEDSVRQYRQALEIDPNLFRALVEGAFPLIALRRWSDGLDNLDRAQSVYGEHPRILGLRGHILGATGERAAALDVLSGLRRIERDAFVPSFDLALLWIGLGELEKAVAELERSYEQQNAATLFAGCLSIFDSLHGNSRYETLIRKLS